jgi:hypothetical protein
MIAAAAKSPPAPVTGTPDAPSLLAAAIYKLLVRRLHGRTPTLTYGELVRALAPRHVTHRRSPALHAALGEVSLACRARGLPCLPALVHRADTGRPGPAYFRTAHPRVRAEAAQRAAWDVELAAVVIAEARYPPRL